MAEVLKVATRGSASNTRTSQPADRVRPKNIPQGEGNGGRKSDKGAKSFDGLKKEFLSTKPKSNNGNEPVVDRPSHLAQCPPDSDMPHLRKKPANASGLEMPEVQEAMKNATPLLASRG